jgi:predicted metal-binding membrane protein
MVIQKTSHQTFFGVLALLFAASSVATIVLCRSMSGMGDMRMPGGWAMSMVWMLMPGQTWFGAAASFLGMWSAMMVAMMLPSLAPALRRYRDLVAGNGATRLDLLTATVGVGYFFVWIVIGMAVFPLGFALSDAEMQHPDLSRAVPAAVGVIVLTVGALQFTAWKARRLSCCRETPKHGLALPASVATAWRHGRRLGVQCACCCLGLMMIVVILGVMDLRLMAIVTVAVTAERLASNGVLVARGIGWVTVAAGAFLIARAVGLC